VTDLIHLVEEPRRCSYLPSETAALEYRIVSQLRADEYEDLLARGYRRFGRQLFRPSCPGCDQCVSVRILVDEFRPTASQRRVLRKNTNITVAREPVYVTDRHLALYNRYHAFMAEERGWRSDRISRADYYESFVDGAGDFAQQWMFHCGDKLVGVALMDETASAASLVYAFHDPEWRPRGPGVFAILAQLAYARERGLRYAYPGYWIESNRSMAYKAKFRPFEQLDGIPAADEVPRWRRSETA